MNKSKTYPVLESIKSSTIITKAKYESMYSRSLNESDDFWAEQARGHLDWFKEWDEVSDCTASKIRWFVGRRLNVAYNCIDRHLELRASQMAIIWEGDEHGLCEKMTY